MYRFHLDLMEVSIHLWMSTSFHRWTTVEDTWIEAVSFMAAAFILPNPMEAFLEVLLNPLILWRVLLLSKVTILLKNKHRKILIKIVSKAIVFLMRSKKCKQLKSNQVNSNFLSPIVQASSLFLESRLRSSRCLIEPCATVKWYRVGLCIDLKNKRRVHQGRRRNRTISLKWWVVHLSSKIINKIWTKIY